MRNETFIDVHFHISMAMLQVKVTRMLQANHMNRQSSKLNVCKGTLYTRYAAESCPQLKGATHLYYSIITPPG